MRRLLAVSLCVGLLSLSSCFDGDGSATSDSDGGVANGAWDSTWTLPIARLSGNEIVNSYPQRIRGYCSNMGTSTEFLFDTSKAKLDTVHYALSGNLLLVGGDTSSVGSSGKALRWAIYERVSGSAGSILGTWNYTFRDSLKPLNIPESDTTLARKRAEGAKYAAANRAAGKRNQIHFTTTAIELRVVDGNWAMLQVADWNDYDAKQYNVTAAMVDANTVTFTAEGETVTKTRLNRNDVRYTSTNPAHPTYVDYYRPSNLSQCPEKEWFWSFLSSHFKSTVAGRAIQGSQPVQRDFWH
ncbi:MAG: hypothetical protein RL318_17 [Fibrobacterota bacterium]|jgi:hypothetical protein